MRRRWTFALAPMAVLAACAATVDTPPPAASEVAADAADAIYHGGAVITVDDAETVAEAVAVRDGRILAVGAEADLLAAHRGAETELVDLEGGALLPGFIDAHGHFMSTGMAAQSANLLAPPDGSVANMDGLVAALAAHADSAQAGRLGWILGMGYDDAQLAERRHPTREDLDRAGGDLPILAIHQSGHLAAMNSIALAQLGIDANSEDPEGGHIRRAADGRTPNGVLEETAFFAAAGRALAAGGAAGLPAQIAAAQDAYVRAGFTTAQEGRAQLGNVQALTAMNGAGALAIDVVLYADPTLMPDPDAAAAQMFANVSRDYEGRFRVGGMKLSLDGSPQGKTAWLTEPYHVVPEGRDADYRGYPQLTDEVLDKWLGRAFDEGWQLLVHVNGDAAVDQYLDAVERYEDLKAAERYQGAKGGYDRRPVAIHAQTTRADQLDRMKTLGIVPSFFSSHSFYWGDWHRDSVLGQERAAFISPAAAALERGIIYTSHNDAPVTLPNAAMMLYAQVNRRTRSGQLLGPDQRVGIMDAIRAITKNAAYQLFEEGEKGTIEAGKRADFVLLDRNPIEMAPETLLDLKVRATIKDGKPVYTATD